MKQLFIEIIQNKNTFTKLIFGILSNCLVSMLQLHYCNYLYFSYYHFNYMKRLDLFIYYTSKIELKKLVISNICCGRFQI